MPDSSSRRDVLKTAGAATGVAALAGCSGFFNGDAAANGDNDVEPVDEDLPEEDITIAHTLPPQPWEKDQAGAEQFKAYVEDRSGGQATVDISGGGELGGTLELAEQAMDGTIEIVSSLTDGYMSTIDPNFSVLGIPYAFPNLGVARRVVAGEFGERLRQSAEEQAGLKLLPMYDTHYNSFGVADQVSTIDDFEGRTIRAMPGVSQQAVINALGASPQSMDVLELYEGMDQGVVDGYLAPHTTITMGAGLHEVHDHIYHATGAEGLMQTLFVVNACNADWFENLHPTYQQIMTEGFYVWKIWAYHQLDLMLEGSWGFFDDVGMEVTEPSPAESEELRDQIQEPVIEEIRDDVTDPEIVDELFDAVEEAEDYMTPDFF